MLVQPARFRFLSIYIPAIIVGLGRLLVFIVTDENERRLVHPFTRPSIAILGARSAGDLAGYIAFVRATDRSTCPSPRRIDRSFTSMRVTTVPSRRPTFIGLSRPVFPFRVS